MGYTHYYYVSGEFDAESFAKVAADFKKMVTPLKHLGVMLGDGVGKDYPIISPKRITFNGLEKCGHAKRDLGITWPSNNASGVLKNGTDTILADITKSRWFAGVQLESRVCGGDCSHETFSLEQKLDTVMTRYDGSTYEMEPQKEYKSYTNSDGIQDRTDKDKIGKYFQCTKTAYKPYDLAVTVCLVIAKHHLGEQIVIHSDGTMNNWHEAMNLCHHFLGYGLGFSLDDEDSEPLDKTAAENMIAEYRKNTRQISIIESEQEKIEEEKSNAIRDIKDRYDKTIDDLQRQKYTETSKISEEMSAIKKQNNEKIAELSDARKTLDRTILFLKASNEKQDTDKFEIRPYDRYSNEKYLEKIEEYHDECSTIRMYIVSNDRPKNKYSIIVAGKTILASEKILSRRYSYGVGVHDKDANMLTLVRCFATIDEAKKYHSTHPIRNVLKDFFEEYDSVYKEYAEVCSKYSASDFAVFLRERFEEFWKSSRSQEYWAKKYGIPTTQIDKMSEKQIQTLALATY
jgi:hypothetical protein